MHSRAVLDPSLTVDHLTVCQESFLDPDLVMEFGQEIPLPRSGILPLVNIRETLVVVSGCDLDTLRAEIISEQCHFDAVLSTIPEDPWVSYIAKLYKLTPVGLAECRLGEI